MRRYKGYFDAQGWVSLYAGSSEVAKEIADQVCEDQRVFILKPFSVGKD